MWSLLGGVPSGTYLDIKNDKNTYSMVKISDFIIVLREPGTGQFFMYIISK